MCAMAMGSKRIQNGRKLGPEWRQYDLVFPRLQQSNIDIISLEYTVACAFRSFGARAWENYSGAIDVATDHIETPEEVAETLRHALKYVDADKLYHAPIVVWLLVTIFSDA